MFIQDLYNLINSNWEYSLNYYHTINFIFVLFTPVLLIVYAVIRYHNQQFEEYDYDNEYLEQDEEIEPQDIKHDDLSSLSYRGIRCINSLEDLVLEPLTRRAVEGTVYMDYKDRNLYIASINDNGSVEFTQISEDVYNYLTN